MMEPEVHSDGTIVDVTGQRSSIRQTACKIQHTVLFTPKFRRRTRELVGFQDCANQGIDCMKIDISWFKYDSGIGSLGMTSADSDDKLRLAPGNYI